MQFDATVGRADEEMQKRREIPVTITVTLSDEDRARIQLETNARCRSAWSVVKRRGRWTVVHTSMLDGTVEALSVRRKDGKIVPWQWPSRAVAREFLEGVFAHPVGYFSLGYKPVVFESE